MLSQSVFLPRPDLTEKILNAVRQYSLTAVVAPMGYGKTTLARSIAESAQDAAYSYAVPAGPHDAPFLWHDMFSRFETQGMDIAPAMLRLGFPEAPSQWRQAVVLLRGLNSPAYLIFDDCHLITDPALFAFWKRVIREKLPDFRIVLFSRTHPDVSLEELRIKQYAAVFEQDVLAFSEAETREYFRIHGISDAAAATEAQNYSEGWPAALWLCLQSWQTGGRIIESHSIDSLLAGVFTAYGREEQDLLMRLSVLENFTERDAHQIATLPHCAANLRKLRGKNPFLAFDAKAGRYQFHAIFKEFLRKELDHSAHIDKTALYRLAGECCVKRRDLVTAVRLFGRAGRDEDLVRLLDTLSRYEDDRNTIFFAEERFLMATAAPWRVRLQTPLGWLAVVGYYALMWNDHRTAHLLEEAEERFRAAPEIPACLKQRIQGEIEVIRASLAFNDADKILHHFTEAHRLLNGPSMFSSEDSAWNFGSPCLTFLILRKPGEYSTLLEKEERIVRLYGKLSGGREKGGLEVLRAESLLESGKFAEAESLLLAALRKCDGDDKLLAAILSGSFNLARLHAATGSPEKASGLLRRLRPQVERLDVVEHFECIDMAEGYINAVLGNAESIPQWLRDGEVFDPPHNVLPHVFGFSLAIHGKALMLQGKYRRLAAVAGEIADAAPITSLLACIHGKVLKAVAAWHLADRDAALKSLREALELSRPDGIILSPAEYGGHILPLLRALKRIRAKDAHLEAVLSVAGRIARVAGHLGSSRTGGPLSPREREFMGYVAEGMTVLSVAEYVGLSRDTVKETLQRAYKKLGAAKRYDAIRRFVELYGKNSRTASQ